MTILLDGMTDGATLGPDGLFSRGPRMVVDASHVQSVEHDGLQLVPIAEIFADPNATFIGFGMPNVYITVPAEGADRDEAGSVDDEAPRWEKYAAAMFWRQRSHVADTRGRVQGGVLFELVDPPIGAVSELRTTMRDHAGRRTISCARANAELLHHAGFTSGLLPLSHHIRPAALARRIWEHGLEHRGRPIALRVIQTTGSSVTDHFASVISKESTSLGRLVTKQWKKLRKNHGDPAPVIDPRALERADTNAGDEARGGELRVGRPNRLGSALCVFWGDHPIFEAFPDRAVADLDSTEFSELNEPLPAYPGRPDLATRAKKHVLFSPRAVRSIRRLLARDMVSVGQHSGQSMAAMLRVGTADRPFMYNAVLTSNALRIARLENQSRKDVEKANWVLSKHVLVAGYDPDVRFAGEFWVEDLPDGRVVHVNNNSGTYQPGPERTEAAARFISEGFGIPVAHDAADL